MKWTLNILFFFSIIAASAQVNQVDTKGRKQGKWEKIYPGTRVYTYKGQFKDDKPIGKFTYFYKSGKVKAVIEHNAGSNRSVGYYYHPTGGLMSYGIYRSMKKDSIWTNFDKKAMLINKETYYKDSLHGTKVVFYAKDERMRKQMPSIVSNYKEGMLDGNYTEYFPSRTVKVKGAYKSNKKHGPWESYHPNGKKMMFTRYKDGARHGWCMAYDKTGKETGKKYFYYGRHLEGKALKKKMEEMKRLGLNPNE